MTLLKTSLHERHDVTNHWQLDWFVRQLVQAVHCWPFVSRINRWIPFKITTDTESVSVSFRHRVCIFPLRTTCDATQNKYTLIPKANFRILKLAMHEDFHWPSFEPPLNRSLTRYLNVRVAHVPGREGRERFPRHRPQRKLQVSDPGMHHTRALVHVGIANPWWRGKRYRHSRRMRNPQFYVSGKRPITYIIANMYRDVCWSGWI